MSSQPISHVRKLAQADPVPVLVARWGETVTTARERRDAFVDTLRELDKLHQQLKERDITVAVDLGPVGNIAASTRRDLEKEQQGGKFELPRGGAA